MESLQEAGGSERSLLLWRRRSHRMKPASATENHQILQWIYQMQDNTPLCFRGLGGLLTENPACEEKQHQNPLKWIFVHQELRMLKFSLSCWELQAGRGAGKRLHQGQQRRDVTTTDIYILVQPPGARGLKCSHTCSSKSFSAACSCVEGS